MLQEIEIETKVRSAIEFKSQLNEVVRIIISESEN